MRFYLKQRENDIWYICWTKPDGRPGRTSTRTRDSEEAERVLARYLIEHDRPRDQLLTATTVETVLIRYWANHAKKLSDRGIVRRVIGLVCEHAPMLSLADLTIPRQEQFIREAMPGVKDGTRRRYMGVIEAAMNWSFRRGEIERQIPILLPSAVDGEGARPLAPSELARFLAAAQSEHEQRLALLLATTGARPQAVLQLDWSRVLPGAVDYDVPGRRKTKKRRARAPLAPTVARYLEDRRSVGPVIQWGGKPLKSHRMTISRIMERAGLEATAYSVRKGLATWLAEKDVPEWEVGRVLGHRVSSGTTERYAHHRPSYMRATRDAIEALLREISPGWLASYLPAPIEAAEPVAKIVNAANGLDGSREWDRTTDHLHVKDDIAALFQGLTPANDDK
jgi:integrase